jgi:hypothetical protein
MLLRVPPSFCWARQDRVCRTPQRSGWLTRPRRPNLVPSVHAHDASVSIYFLRPRSPASRPGGRGRAEGQEIENGEVMGSTIVCSGERETC